MDRNVHLQKTNSAVFLEALKQRRVERLGRAKERYLLSSAALAARREELAVSQRGSADTAQLLRMVLRLEASQAAHRKLIRTLETS